MLTEAAVRRCRHSMPPRQHRTPVGSEYGVRVPVPGYKMLFGAVLVVWYMNHCTVT
jgi:hypothetical protein